MTFGLWSDDGPIFVLYCAFLVILVFRAGHHPDQNVRDLFLILLGYIRVVATINSHEKTK